MAMNTSIETLFKEHSLEEIESVKDNLSIEIEKRTDQLKSIVKEKYRDIVETSDAIQSMKISLKDIEQSLWTLDKNISQFYLKIKEPPIELNSTNSVNKLNINLFETNTDNSTKVLQEDDSKFIHKLISNSSEVWNYFDSGNLKQSVRLLNETIESVREKEANFSKEHLNEFNNIKESLNRFMLMIRNNLWHRIQSAAADQIGIIAGGDDEDLYRLSLECSIEFLVLDFLNDISNISYHAQIRRYQECSYFDSQTNEIIQSSKDQIKSNSNSSCVQIPKYTSPELNSFLYNVCRVINTIAGFNLNRTSIFYSLEMTIRCALDVYKDIIPLVNDLKCESKRKRALQLYFDLLYLRILLNQSKNTDLIESLDPCITELANKYEVMLDSIELYMISSALHANIMSLSQSTIRLHGLLIPHLQ